MTSADYFAGRDPALEFARRAPELRSIPQLAVALGGELALAESQRRTVRFGQVTGWHPFNEGEMNSAGYALKNAGRPRDAVTVMRANVAEYPASGNTWDSLGEILLAAGDTAGGVASYRRAILLDPGNQGAREIVQRWGKP